MSMTATTRKVEGVSIVDLSWKNYDRGGDGCFEGGCAQPAEQTRNEYSAESREMFLTSTAQALANWSVVSRPLESRAAS